jgi:predicted ABC-type sugar transport system permease subunit
VSRRLLLAPVRLLLGLLVSVLAGLLVAALVLPVVGVVGLLAKDQA